MNSVLFVEFTKKDIYKIVKGFASLKMQFYIEKSNLVVM